VAEYGGFHVVTDREGRVNAGFVVTELGTIAIDAMYTPEDVHGLMRAVETAGAPPIRYVLITHGHVDHVSGASAYRADLIAHEKTAEAIRQQQAAWREQGIEVPLPQIRFRDHLTLALGGVELQVRHMGGHAPELCAIFFPQRRSLWISDLVFAGRPPFLPPAADLARWMAALEEAAAWQPEVVIPGHGQPGGPELLEQQRRWFSWFLTRVEELGRQLGTPERVLETLGSELDLPERAYVGYRTHIEALLAGKR
jgi:cyclase